MRKPYQQIKLNTVYAFEFNLLELKLGNLSIDKSLEVLSDGRPFSFFIEPHLALWFEPLEQWRKGKIKIGEIVVQEGKNSGNLKDVRIEPDFDKIDNKYYDQKTYTSSTGCSCIKSSMKGINRVKDDDEMALIVKNVIYIITDNTNLPKVRVVFIDGEEFLNKYSSGSISFNKIEKFFKQYPMASSEDLDQFYTKPSVAARLYKDIEDKFDIDSFEWMLEPSAGDGAFFKHFPVDKRFGIDLEPKFEEIQEINFFDYTFPHNGKGIIIGNPPFGQNSSTAVKFFNRSAKYADVIAFIVPRTFRKATIQNRLDMNFYIIHEEILSENSFIFENNEYSVPCVFQIWVKKDIPRKKVNLPTTHTSFSMVPKEDADFAVQRVGAGAGKLKTEFENCAAPSHYFIKSNHDKVLENMKKIDFDTVKYDTAGNPSIGLSELVYLYSKIDPPEPDVWDNLFT